MCTALAFLAAFAQQTKTIERHVPTKPGQAIDIRRFSGSEVDVKSWDKNEVYVNIKIEFESSDRDFEQEYIKMVDIDQEQTDAALVLTLKQPTHHREFSWTDIFRLHFSQYTSNQISGEIYVPRENPLTLEANYSTVTLENMRGALTVSGRSSTIHFRGCNNLHDVDNDYGTSTIEQCGGDLHLTSRSSKMTVDTFDGPVTIDADYATIKLYGIKKSATVNSKSATITADQMGGNVDVQSDYSTVTVTNVKGFVQIQDKSGKMRINSVEGLKVDGLYATVEVNGVHGKSGKPITVKGQSGRLDLEQATGDVVIDNPYSPIVLRSIRGNIDIRSRSSNITIEDVVGNLTARAEYSSFDVANLDADQIMISNKSNPVELELKKSPSKLEIQNEYGDVKVRVPKDYSGSLNLKVSYGKIKTDLPLEIEDLGSGAFFVGKLGEKKNSIAISTKSGNIYLETESGRTQEPD